MIVSNKVTSNGYSKEGSTFDLVYLLEKGALGNVLFWPVLYQHWLVV